MSRFFLAVLWRWRARRKLDPDRVRELEYETGIRQRGFVITGGQGVTFVPCQVNGLRDAAGIPGEER